MLKFLRSFIAPGPSAAAPHTQPAPPDHVAAPGAPDFDVARHLVDANGLPVLDWVAAGAWVAALPDAPAQQEGWNACEMAWLAHLATALGADYRLIQQGQVVLLSNLDGHVAQATIAFVGRTLQRIQRVLDGIAQPTQGQEILVVFDEDETYYRYLAHYYPDAGEFAGSGGVFINAGCGHFATVKAGLHAIEPVIAHDGPGALAVVDRDRPELAILDIGLPGMDGYELARQLRERPGLAGVPVVALTGYGQASDRDRTKAAGFVEHLVKPIDLQRLHELVGRFV